MFLVTSPTLHGPVLSRRDAVTGAFGFTGRHIAERLLAGGREVVTLSRRSGSGDPLAERLTVRPLDFREPHALTDDLRGIDTLYNTYWMRFPRGSRTFRTVIEESALLIGAARRAGIRRLVHVSVVNASSDASTPYVRAKAAVEAIVRDSGMEWAIVRPTLTFGPDDILINNLAWALRRLPVFGVPGFGRYRVQPVHVEDVAWICIEAATGPPGLTVDAAGPETLPYRELVDLVRRAVRSRSIVVPMPRLAVLAAGTLLGLLVRDRVLTPSELEELTSSLLTSAEPPRGEIRLSDWVAANADALGRRWANELSRNYALPAW
jgi:NADH dehydrogenase